MRNVKLDPAEVELILQWALEEAENIQEGSVVYPNNVETLADCERIIAKLTI